MSGLIQWRLGAPYNRGIYIHSGEGAGHFVGIMETPRAAELVVEAFNLLMQEEERDRQKARNPKRH